MTLLLNNVWQRIGPNTREIARDVLQLLPVAAFLFISSTPANSLTYVELREAPYRALQFIRDDTLLYVIQGVPAQSARSLASRLPAAVTNVSPGMAIRVFATAYSSTVNQTDANPYTTASGSTVGPGTIAANFLPFGTVIKVGNQLYTVEDRLNSRYNGKSLIDIWFPTQEQALAFGVRAVEVEIVSLPL